MARASDTAVHRRPDLTARPFNLVVERQMRASADALYRAWTEDFDRWFAAEGSLLMRPAVDAPFYFDTEFDGQRHPHYGRFLALEPGRRIEMTWVTGTPGTGGAETVITIEFTPNDDGTLLTLSHAGFSDARTRNGHREAWPQALEILDDRIDA